MPDDSDLPARDHAVVWHPYTSFINPPPVYPVVSASGVRLRLADGRELVDGMSSWWCAIHGYNHPRLNDAATAQLASMSHVMFGGLTHAPAVNLAERLLAMTPAGLDAVFFADSGSVAVEVAMKMAIQYQVARGQPGRNRFLAVRGGYHGDTSGAMSVSDPDTGMHTLFGETLRRQLFAERPGCRFDDDWDESCLEDFRQLIAVNHGQIAAVILEPVVQGAGGMWFYHPQYLVGVRRLCDEYDVPLIFDEIATGFGRTGRMFALEHAGVRPDILCVGKALTGGYLTLAATLPSRQIAEIISADGQGSFMHGPTFMANPLACAVALANLDLLDSWDWQTAIASMGAQMEAELGTCRDLPIVRDVRTLGGIGVIELDRAPPTAELCRAFVDQGVWIRPFGRLVYIMPPYIIDETDLSRLTGAMLTVIRSL